MKLADVRAALPDDADVGPSNAAPEIQRRRDHLAWRFRT